MPHLWIRDETEQWAVFPLLFHEYSLERLLKSSETTTADAITISLVRNRQEETDVWHLLAPFSTRVSVNGLPMTTGLRTLRDRDQITIGHRSAYFSIEERAECVAFPGTERKFFCARCRQELTAGALAVRCPQCNVWHHQSEELPCWTYTAHCGLCSQPTDLEAGYRWQPDE
jgi:hypothetical protein